MPGVYSECLGETSAKLESQHGSNYAELKRPGKKFEFYYNYLMQMGSYGNA